MSEAFVRHERSITMAVVVVIPVLLVLGLMWRESKQRLEDIQASRAEITYTNCLETNNRHANSLKVIDDAIARRRTQLREQVIAAEAEGDSRRATQLRQQIDQADDSRPFFLSILDALNPVQNCEQVVLDRFGYVPDLATPEEG